MKPENQRKRESKDEPDASEIKLGHRVDEFRETCRHTDKPPLEIEDDYRELVGKTDKIIVRMNTKGCVTSVNGHAEDLFGYTADEIIGRNVVGTIFPDTDTWKRNLKTMIRDIGKHPERYAGNEDEIICRNGERAWIAWTSMPVLDDEGGICEIACICNDLTRQRRGDEALRRSEEKYRTLIENIQDGVFIIQDAKLKFVNEAFCRMGGLTVEEVAKGSLDFRDFVAPEDLAMVADRYFRMMAREDVPMEYEFRALKKDGVTRTIVNMTVGYLNYQGKLAAFGTVKDITLRRQMEDALVAEKERLSVTLRSIGDGVIATDAEGKVVLINKVAEELTGWSQEDSIGNPLTTVFHIINEKTRRRCENPAQKVIETGRVVDMANNTILIARDGTERVIADSGAPILDKEGRTIGMIVVFRDVTERRRAREELVRADKLESVGLLAGGIAHDFNNILTGILGNVTLAKIHARPEDKIFQRLDAAEKACSRATDLTLQLLTFSRGGKPITKAISIARLVEESVSFSLSGSNVKCECLTPDNLWPVEADEGQISQVINNLLINADQAMPEGGTIELRAENVIVKAEDRLPLAQGKYVKISIRDHGIGILKKHLSKVFDPYFTSKNKGSGLGLASAHSIVKGHDGYLTVESEVGIGTVFHVYLRASLGKKEELEKETGKLIKGTGTILLMDDEEMVLEAAGEMLMYFGYDVQFARDGHQAVELFRQAKEAGYPFAAVIMDLTVPGGMGGKKTIKRILEIDPGVKAIVSSGYSNDPVMADFRQYGFCGLVTKPYNMKQLSDTLQKVL